MRYRLRTLLIALALVAVLVFLILIIVPLEAIPPGVNRGQLEPGATHIPLHDQPSP